MEEQSANAAADDFDVEILRNFISGQLAKFEMRELLSDRLALKAKARGKRAKEESEAVQEAQDLEYIHSLIECLPQGNRCTQPPREPFLTLASEAAATAEDPMTTAHKAFLLEEYAIQLFAQHGDSPHSRTCETASAWALACSGVKADKLSGRERETLHSKRIASQLHSVVERLSTGNWGEEQVSDEPKRSERQAAPRSRKRRRKRSRASRSSDGDDEQLPEKKHAKIATKTNAGNASGRAARKGESGYYSSDNYKSEGCCSD